MPMSMMTIATLLVVKHATGSYGVAGAASAAGTLSQAAATPLVGRLVDRRGQSAVLPRLLVLYLSGVALLVSAAAAKAPLGLLFLGAVLAGAGQLPYPSLVRTRWSYLLGESPDLSTALALESAADEVIFIVGPVLVTGLATVTTLLAPVVAGILALLGTVPFLAARASEPPPAPTATRVAAWRIPGMWVLIGTGILLGVIFGGFEVDLVAFAQRHHAPGMSGVLLGLIAFGSMAGGLWYGARRWRRDLAARYRLSLVTLALGGLPAIAAASVWQMAPASLLVGLSIAPTLIASSGLVARVTPPGAMTEGFTWQSTGINIGVAAGSGLAGVLVDEFSLRTAIAVGPIAAVLAALVALAGSRWLAAPPARNYAAVRVSSGQTA
jgi:MFS family permease